MMRKFDRRAKILVLDDEPSICRALSLAFERVGADVRAVVRGEDALALLRTEHFDCLVVDLRVPDVRGDILFELAASLQPHLRAATVFTTGDASEFAQDLIGACGCPLVEKPFDLEELIGVVQRMLSEGGRRRA